MKLHHLIHLAIHKRLNQLLRIETTNKINSFKN